MLVGLVVGPPKTPKSLPVPPGPPAERSTLPKLNALELFELTCTLLGGPPVIVKLVAPFPLKALASVGCVMRSGTAEITDDIPAVPLTPIVEDAGPRSAISVVLTCLCTVT